jgi:Transposase IS4
VFFLLGIFVLTSTVLFFRMVDDDGHLHGCNVLYYLVKPWANTDAVVVADSYFASVPAALRLKSIGLRFIGVIKTATKEYPMRYLSSIPLPGGRGSRKGLLSTDAESGTQLLSFVWVDRDRRYFISTCSSLEEGSQIVRHRWTQRDTTANAEPSRLAKVVPQPKAAETYYKAAGKIDQHNRTRQDTLQLERKLQTNNWDKRVNTTLFAMIVVDSFLLAKGCSGSLALKEPGFFIQQLAEELIDNDYDKMATRNKKRSREVEPLPAAINTSLYLTNPTPTKRLRQNKKTGKLSICKQGRCFTCKKAYTTYVCRECQLNQIDPSKKQFWSCKAGSACFDEHIRTAHPHKVLPTNA